MSITKGMNVLTEHKKKKINFDAPLKQVNFLDRRVYKRAEGVYYPSVTTILNYMPKNSFFMTWLKDVGHNADFIAKRAADEGTQVHQAIEDLVEGNEISWIDDYGNAKYNENVWGMILKFAEFWNNHKPKLISSEEFAYSDEHQFAGTADLVVEMDGEIWLLDIKTSNALHKTYDMQLAAYAKALKETRNLEIQRTGVVWLKSSKRQTSNKPGVYQGKGWEIKIVDEIEYNFDLFQTVYKLYKLENPTTEPIYSSYPTTISLSFE